MTLPGLLWDARMAGGWGERWERVKDGREGHLGLMVCLVAVASTRLQFNPSMAVISRQVPVF